MRRFDPRSRAGSDRRDRIVIVRRDVSIRAPVQGATSGDSDNNYQWPACFDPRSRAGSDTWRRRGLSGERCFDPRSRAGSDSRVDGHGWECHRFDPRSRAGSDARVRSITSRNCGFDPRSRAGSDCSAKPVLTLIGFDPRSRAGSDRTFTVGGHDVSVSIRAPVQGATLISSTSALSASVSIRAPVQGATTDATRVVGAVGFRSALPCRERPPYRSHSAGPIARFDPRSRAGSDTRAGEAPD